MSVCYLCNQSLQVLAMTLLHYRYSAAVEESLMISCRYSISMPAYNLVSRAKRPLGKLLGNSAGATLGLALCKGRAACELPGKQVSQSVMAQHRNRRYEAGWAAVLWYGYLPAAHLACLREALKREAGCTGC